MSLFNLPECFHCLFSCSAQFSWKTYSMYISTCVMCVHVNYYVYVNVHIKPDATIVIAKITAKNIARAFCNK